VVAQAFEFAHVPRGDQNGLAHQAQLANQFAHFDPSARIETPQGIIEQKHERVMGERAGQAQTPAHPWRERFEWRAAAVAEIDQLQQVTRQWIAFAGGHAMACRKKDEVLAGSHIGILAELGGHIARNRPDSEWIRRNRQAMHPGFAAARRQQGSQYAEKGGLARAERTHQPVGAACARAEIDPIEGNRLSKASGQGPGFDSAGHVIFARGRPR
jgi:hypothetical protein